MGNTKNPSRHSDAIVNCHICDTPNNVDVEVYRIQTDNNHGNDYAGKSCSNCKVMITVVVSIWGARSIENELKRIIYEKKSPIK